MHNLLVRASRLTLSFFAVRPWFGTREHCMPAHPVHDVQHTLGSTPIRRTACPVQAERLPERHARSAAPGTPKTHLVRPVRVLRMREGTSERLAIVGRMADVCAELDRLVARDPQLIFAPRNVGNSTPENWSPSSA